MTEKGKGKENYALSNQVSVDVNSLLSLPAQVIISVITTIYPWGFPGGSDGKESSCSAGDLVQSLGQGDPLEKGMATPLWYS